tara:strand:+ start:1687 stop:3357 length:1671 start_codon:yes stop_codon:yes gene_type:complete
MNSYVIGLDFGTDSVRALLVNTSNGDEIANSVYKYDMWSKGLFCEPKINQYRQHPSDHFIGLEHTIKEVIFKSKIKPDNIKAISIDTTGSSPIAVSKDGTALAFKKGFENNPNAMVVLWKDHTAVAEAEEINQLANEKNEINYLKFSGGIYSSEWFWAKILHIIRVDINLKRSAYSWMEHCDYLTFSIIEDSTLSSFKRSRCAAGHKAMWHESWNGLPDKSFLNSLDPYLSNLRDRLYKKTFSSDYAAGNLSSKWANTLGLSPKTIVGVGTFDAHSGAIGARIENETLVKVMGTSTCDIMIGSSKYLNKKVVSGICGQVEDSVIPGYYGLEAGQSAFGDYLAWFKKIIEWPLKNTLNKTSNLNEDQKKELFSIYEDNLLVDLTHAASKLEEDFAVPVSLDWINGRRTPYANQNLKAAFSNLTLGSGAPEIFLSLIYAICFGSKKIIERFSEEGLKIKKVIGVGGIAKKSPFIMQTMANVLDIPISICLSEQTPALGTAISASVASGIYKTIPEAIKIMGSDFEKVYYPEKNKVERLKKMYINYHQLSMVTENELKN